MRCYSHISDQQKFERATIPSVSEKADDCKCGDTASNHLQRDEPRKGVDDSKREEENVAKRKEGE